MVINHTIKLATLDHIKNKYKWDPSLCGILKGGLAIIFPGTSTQQKKKGNLSERIGFCTHPAACANVSIIFFYSKVSDVPLFQYEREDNRRVDLEVVMVRARKGGRTSWPLPVNEKRLK